MSKLNVKGSPYKWALFFLVVFFTSPIYASSGVTYHGRLLNPDGTPVTASSVQFRMQIRTPGTEDCLLYEEIQTHDLSTKSGMFALSLGDGTGVRQDSYPWTIFDTFSNRKNFSFNAADCSGATTYNPNASDNRRFRVFFNDGSFTGWEALPVQTINFIPMSIESYTVGGFTADSLLRIEDAGGTLGTTTPLTSTQYAEILALVGGTSSQYEKDGELNGSSLPTISANESVRWTGSAWQSFTPLTSETDPNVEAFAKSSLPTCATGEVLKSNGTSLSCVTDAGGWSAVDATTTVKGIVNVPTAGGLEVTSGAIGLPDVVTGGTYTKVTVDAKGRVTTGANITGSDITSGTIGGSTSISTTGSVSAASMSVRQIDLYDSDNTHHISFLTPATTDLTSNYDLIFPSTLGTSNQVLGMNNAGTALENKSITAGSGVTITHSAGGIAIAATGSGGTVTSVTGTSPISVTTGTTTPVISLDDAGTAGTYGSSTEVPVFTTDAKGRVTSVTETTISGVSPVGSTLATGQVWIGDGSGNAQARFIGFSDLKTSIAGNANQIPTTCTASQTMTYSAVTDVFSCTSISITASQVSDLSTELSDYVEVAGDTMTGTLNLPSNGLAVGTSELVVSGGNVGIGTSTPRERLELANGGHVFHTGGDLVHYFNMYYDGSVPEVKHGGYGGGSKYGARIQFSPTTGTFLINTTLAPGAEDDAASFNTGFRMDSSGNIGIGTTDLSTRLNVGGTIKITDGGETCSATADGGMIRYNGGNLQFCNESAWQTLGVSGSGLTSLNGQTGSTQTFATPGTTGNAPNWSSASDAHTLNIPMASSSGTVTAGLLSNAEYTALNSKLSSSLASANILIGNGSNVATARAVSGDISVTNLGAVTVDSIQNIAVSTTDPTTAQVLKYDGTDYEPSFIGLSDIRSTVNSANNLIPNNCTSSQTLVYSAVTDTFSCTTITYTETDPKMQTLTTSEVDQLENIGANTISSAQWGYLSGLSAAPVTSSTAFIQNGNSFTGAATLGTNDAYALNFETSGSSRMTILSGGNVGIGTTAPESSLHIAEINLATFDATDTSFQETLMPTITVQNMANDNIQSPSQIVLKSRATTSTPRAVRLVNIPDGTGANFAVVTGAAGAPTEKFRITADGNVGIGTSNPTSKLTVSSNSSPLPTPPPDTHFHFAGPDGTSARFLVDSFVNGATGGSSMTFRTANGTAAAPSAQLTGDLLGQLAWFGYGATGYSIGERAAIRAVAAENWTDTAHGTHLIFRASEIGTTYSDEKMRIADNGNVGIGTTNPTTKLHAASSATTTEAVAKLETTGTDGRPYLSFRAESTDYGYVGYGSTGNDDLILMNYQNAPVIIGNNGVERLHIDTTGYVGIGSTSPTSKLDVAGTIMATGHIGINEISGTFTNSNTRAFISNAGYFWSTMDVAAGSANLYLHRHNTTSNYITFGYGATTVGGVSTNGTSVSFNTTSDYRLKENIVPMTDALDRLMSLPTKRFNYKTNPEQTVDGFIAHEVAEVVPEAVTGKKDAVDEKGEIIPQLVDYSKIIPLVTGAVQELYGICEMSNQEQDRRLASLERANQLKDQEIQELKRENLELKARMDRIEKLLQSR